MFINKKYPPISIGSIRTINCRKIGQFREALLKWRQFREELLAKNRVVTMDLLGLEIHLRKLRWNLKMPSPPGVQGG